MDANENRCKGCGIVFDDDDGNIDKCVKKRLYCELCLAQKNPPSKTEQKIKKRYTLVTAISALIVVIMLIALNWEKSKNNNILEYLVVFGFSFLLIWGFTSLFFMPVLMRMKKPHLEQIKKEKEEYVEKIEAKKQVRKTQRDQQ